VKVPVLTTPRLILTLPEPSAAPHALAYYTENQAHLEPWEPPRPEGFYGEAFWHDRLERNRREHVEDTSLRLFLFDRDAGVGGPILGSVALTQIVRGALQGCNLGYSLGRAQVGQGLMFEALRAVIDHTWRELGLHRIAANYMPSNERSGRLLRRLGFVIEGYARDYLFLNGAWRDHILTALIRPDS
jgi:ribosomal-protein-alanine N-acetyltransferase